MDEYLNISYIPNESPNNFHSFDIYIPRNIPDDQLSISPLICFIHGGAWRSEDKLDHAAMARRLADFTTYPVAVPNYRLSHPQTTEYNPIRHPDHAKDILYFLKFIISWPGPMSIKVYDPNRLCLMGHSCSAHMLSSIFLQPIQGDDTLRPSVEILNNTKIIILSEGIFDIDLLLSKFPTYRSWFIEPTFGQRSTYEQFSVAKMTPNVDYHHLQWFIVHSKGDSSVDQAQSEVMHQHLLHNMSHVTTSFGELKEEHNLILTGAEFVKLVGQYIVEKMPSSTQ